MTGSDPKFLADRLKALRLSSGYAKARHFARELGISENRYTRYERGEAEPDFALLRTICEKLGATPNELFGWSEAPARRAFTERDGPVVARAPGFAEEQPSPLEPPPDSAGAPPTSLPPAAEMAAWRLASAFGGTGFGDHGASAQPAPLAPLRLTADIFLRLRQYPLATVARLLREMDYAALPPERQAMLSKEIEAFVRALPEFGEQRPGSTDPANSGRSAS